MGSHASPSRFARSVIAVLSLAFGTALLAQTPAPTRSVREGVYTSAQAERGGALYEEKCTGCHAARMWGSDWTDKSLWDLYDTISNYMPQDAPGSLGPQQSRDLVAYILKTNKLPSGTTELSASDDDLRLIRVELPAE